MSMADHLLAYPSTAKTVHLCVDMQRIFSGDGPWPTPWMPGVLPVIGEIVCCHPESTIFHGSYHRPRPVICPGCGNAIVRGGAPRPALALNPELLELMPELRRYSPPAAVIDKTRYSAFFGSALWQHLLGRDADGLIVTGAETDVCVLATVLSAVDLGYRVILVRDALCSSSDEGHDASMQCTMPASASRSKPQTLKRSCALALTRPSEPDAQ